MPPSFAAVATPATALAWHSVSDGRQPMHSPGALLRILPWLLAPVLAACGGSGTSPAVSASGMRMAATVLPAATAATPATVAPKLDPQAVVSAASPFAPGCDREDIGGTNYFNAEVEPSLAIHPHDPARRVAIWQQDRWSNGSSRGIMGAASTDGGQSWTRRPLPFSRCGGGTVANGGDYARVSNPWVAYGGNGIVHAVGLSSSGVIFQSGSVNAIVASRSLDGGLSWSNPVPLIRDGPGFFNDKVAVTVDPVDPNLVYATWDRLVAGDNGGPTYVARSLDGGASWQPARPAYDPGPNAQTISNVIVVARDRTLVNLFVQIDYVGDGFVARIAVIRSFDQGASWTGPTTVAALQSVGTRDPWLATPVRDQSIIPQIAAAPNGAVYVAWQDSRFNGGALDAIVISRSLDGGANWSQPRRVSTPAGVAAFNPSVHVRADGMVGVGYYDFRSDGPAATLLTDTWLARSADGGWSWSESRIAEPFDLAMAPRTSAPFDGGFFLGDYQSLGSVGPVFVPLFAKANNATPANRSDIFHAPAVSATSVTSGRFHPDCGPPRRGALQGAQADTLAVRLSANLKRARLQRLGPHAGAALPRSPNRPVPRIR
ncbi:MAG: exo-alpha-sialidase [Lysobacteraceae bacterium]|nr:MAG: exo-alpha-sialidase [Xanthomonadaceae bacterium]